MKTYILNATSIEMTSGTSYQITTLPDGFRDDDTYLEKIIYIGDGICCYFTIVASVVTIKPLSNVTSGTQLYIYETFL